MREAELALQKSNGLVNKITDAIGTLDSESELGVTQSVAHEYHRDHTRQ